MKIKFLVLLILLSSNLYSQDREIHLKAYVGEDTTFWYKWKTELSGRIGIDTIEKSSHKWNFRFWTEKQVINIWKNSKNALNGRITTWTEEHTSYHEEPTHRIFYKSTILKPGIIQKIVSLIDSSRIEEIPGENLISDWEQGFDGITYIIETTNSKEYFFKTYWMPMDQDSLQEAEIVQNFVKRILKITDAEKIWDKFTQEIPYECFINGGPFITCKVMTRRERKKYRRERKKYRKKN